MYYVYLFNTKTGQTATPATPEERRTYDSDWIQISENEYYRILQAIVYVKDNR